ncbi:MAG: hypothetical protein WCZ23_01735 [Rhodospirillaceae bacterium]
MRLPILLGALLPLVLASCGNLPRPFAHDPDAPPKGLVRLTSGTGVAVLASPGSVTTFSAEEMALALRAFDVPADALVEPRLGGYVLRAALDGSWELSSPAGLPLLVVPATADLVEAGEAVAHAVESDATRPLSLRMAAGVDPSLPVSSPLPTLRVVPEIEGLDGGRARVLVGALEGALRRAGLTLDAAAQWTVAGRLETASAAKGEPVPVRFTWILRGPDGTEQGAAEQANAVPPDTLTRGFAALAAAVAPGAAEGIAALAHEARASR